MDTGDWEIMDDPLDMIERGDQRASVTSHVRTRDTAEVGKNQAEDGQPQASGSRLSTTSAPQANSTNGHSVSGAPPAQREPEDVVPAAIGRETCPICIIDFEEGDDLRLLPCEGKHIFHQECVDPWLLELSSSCPICRHDFQALETMMGGEEEDTSQYPQGVDYPPFHTFSGNVTAFSAQQTQGRFSRYLRFARRRRNRRDRETGSQETEHADDSGYAHEHVDTSLSSGPPDNAG